MNRILIILIICWQTALAQKNPNAIGKYSTLTRMKSVEIELRKDSVFVYKAFDCTAHFLSIGKWNIKNNQMILNSYDENTIKNDTLYNKWVRVEIINNMTLVVKKCKLKVYENSKTPIVLYNVNSRKAKKWMKKDKRL